MTLLVISTTILVFVIIILLFYQLAKKSDAKSRRLNTIMGSYKIDYDDDLEKPFVQRFLLAFLESAIKNLSKLLPKNKGKDTKKTEKNLKLAGLNINVNEYNAIRLIFSGCVLFVTFLLIAFFSFDFKFKAVIMLFSILISIIIPIYFIKFRVSSRQEGIRYQLPDVMDLLSVSIEAGLSFDLALIKITERLSGALVDEFKLVISEIQFGRPRREALKSLSERTAVNDLKTFVSSIVQAEQLGIPIKNVLNSQAQQLRINRRQVAEQKAMKAPVKMMIPLVVFVFPVLFIILLGPTILQIIDQFGFNF